MLMRVALFPPEERVAEVPPDVVREHLLSGICRSVLLLGSGIRQRTVCDVVGDRGGLESKRKCHREPCQSCPGVRVPTPASVETFEVVYTA
jgi:hypothetical protein